MNSQKNPSAGTGADRFSEEYRNVMTARRALAAPGRHDGRYIPADRVLAPEWVLSIEPGVEADRAVDLSTPERDRRKPVLSGQALIMTWG